jgi:hypothetical protein
VVIVVRLVRLEQLPAALYGDIVIVLDMTAAVLRGDWPASFVLSSGPLYHYLVAPIIGLTGLNYLGVKLASVIVSLGVLLVIALLGRELLDSEGALLALFIGGVSSWLLIFSRLGNSQIISPLLTGGALYFALRAYRRRNSYADISASALIATLGLYTYPQNFILPLVTACTLLCLWWSESGGIPWRQVLAFGAITVVWSVPFLLIVLNSPENFSTGYVGEKSLLNTADGLHILLLNIWNSLQALHLRGDVVFRSNVSGQPHLDPISGVLLLLGIGFWLQPGRRALSLALFIPLVLLQLPALLVRYPEQVPSASRTLGIIPMLIILITSGLQWALRRARRHSRPVAHLLLASTLLALLLWNSQRYFGAYAAGLPNHNTPFERVIGTYINTHLPPAHHVYMVGCCWGEWQQPHPRGVAYRLHHPQRLHLVDDAELTCALLHEAQQPATLLWGPDDRRTSMLLRLCLVPHTTPEKHSTSGYDGTIFWSAVLNRE